MVAKSAPGVVLLSIKPKFAEAIMRGEKKVEFRRRPWKSSVEKVLIYATSPTKEIIGYFDVSFVHVGSPEQLWREHGQFGAIDRTAYRSYYTGATSGVAVGVGEVHRLREGELLESVTGLQRPPQSFAYLDSSTLSRLQTVD